MLRQVAYCIRTASSTTLDRMPACDPMEQLGHRWTHVRDNAGTTFGRLHGQPEEVVQTPIWQQVGYGVVDGLAARTRGRGFRLGMERSYDLEPIARRMSEVPVA